MVQIDSFQPSRNFPQLCNKVTVGYDEKRGRFVRALEDIPVGTVVCVEEGITVNVDPSKCYRCLETTEEAGFAYCKNCDEFYEPDGLSCGEYDHLGIFKLAAHLVLTYPFAEIAKLLDSEDPKPATSAPTSLSTTDISSVFQLKPFLDIGESFKTKPIQDAIESLLKALDEDANWGRLDKQIRMVMFAKSLRIMAERCAKNAHTIYSIEQTESKSKNLPIGTGLFPIASIFNHSCTPNVFAFFVKNTFIFVSRGVRAGEELVDSYGVTFQQQSSYQRAQFLEDVSGFKCNCTVCTESKNQDEFFARSFNDVEKCAREAPSYVDLSSFTDYMLPGSKEIENLIMAFSERPDADVYAIHAVQYWKLFIENAKIRGVEFDPYLIRPYMNLTILAWSGDADCSEEEKASFLTLTHRLLQTFYAGLHPLSNIVNTFMATAATGDVRAMNAVLERTKCIVEIVWKSGDEEDDLEEIEDEEDKPAEPNAAEKSEDSENSDSFVLL